MQTARKDPKMHRFLLQSKELMDSNFKPILSRGILINKMIIDFYNQLSFSIGI